MMNCMTKIANRVCKTLCTYAYLLMWQFWGVGVARPPDVALRERWCALAFDVALSRIFFWHCGLRVPRPHCPVLCDPVWKIPPILIDNV